MVNSASVSKVWELLENIPDPEIPEISIVELGVVRSVDMESNSINITITPTYSGCPALSFMKDEIVRHLEIDGYTDYKIITSISPPWTTDWMTDEVKAKLKNAGISPPSKQPICPLCDSENNEVISEFGSTACKALYKCIECSEIFHHFKKI